MPAHKYLNVGFMLLVSITVGCGGDGGVKPSEGTQPEKVDDLASPSATAFSATLTWTAPANDGPGGTVAEYDIRYSTAVITDSTFSSENRAPNLPMPSAEGVGETFTIKGLKDNKTYYFALKAVDEVGNWSDLSNVASATTKQLLNQVTTTPESDDTPDWSPDGDRIAYFSFRGGSAAIWFSPATGGPAVRITEGLDPSWSPNGSQIAFVDDRISLVTNVWTMPATGGIATQVTTDTGMDRSPSWSPDGSQIAYFSIQLRTPTWEIRVIPATGGTSVNIATDRSIDGPSWSPDGSQIAFASDRSGNYDVWTVPVTGGPAVRITTDPFSDTQPSWSPDGSQIAFTSVRSGNYDIWTIPVTGGPAVRITTDTRTDLEPSWSPDGSQIAFTSYRSGNADIWTIWIE